MISFWASFQKERSVLGTRVRYEAATMVVATALAITVLCFVLGVIDVVRADHLAAGMDAIFMLVWLAVTIHNFYDDDNWFNNQWKRLKRGLKSLRRRLTTVKLPRPLPSPT